MWGLWLVVETQHQPAAGQLANSQPQSCMKSGFFSWNNTNECTTFTQQLTGWLQQCATPLQGTQKTTPCAWGLCPVNIRGHYWWCRGPSPVLSEVSQPWEREEPLSSLSPPVWTLKDRGCDQWQRNPKRDHTAQWTFVVLGAQNFVRMLQASNFTHSAWCTELYLSAWSTWGLKCHQN